jgi:site-specific DNA recombinase
MSGAPAGTSTETSKRLRRAFAAAAEGRPGGRVPYSYERIYNPVTRRLEQQRPHADEAPVVAELYSRLRAGHSLRAIARDLGERGIVTCGNSGLPPRPFSPQYLRNLALRPCYGGLRVHQPVSGPRRQGATDGAVAGTWPR